MLVTNNLPNKNEVASTVKDSNKNPAPAIDSNQIIANHYSYVYNETLVKSMMKSTENSKISLSIHNLIVCS